jgi:hypothetical protein
VDWKAEESNAMKGFPWLGTGMLFIPCAPLCAGEKEFISFFKEQGARVEDQPPALH